MFLCHYISINEMEKICKVFSLQILICCCASCGSESQAMIDWNMLKFVMANLPCTIYYSMNYMFNYLAIVYKFNELFLIYFVFFLRFHIHQTPLFSYLCSSLLLLVLTMLHWILKSLRNFGAILSQLLICWTYFFPIERIK
jgi:hypothetical protein